MRRSILQAGAWTAFGLVAAIAVVSASSNRHRAVQTVAPAAKATVASVSAEKCVPTDACCARKASVAPTAFAAAKPTPRTMVASKTARRAGVYGIVAALDPETRELSMPTAEQMAELEAMQQTMPGDDMSHSDVGLTPVYHPNGAMSLDLQGRFQEFGTVHVAPNGKFIFGCADRPALDTPVSHFAPSALEEK